MLGLLIGLAIAYVGRMTLGQEEYGSGYVQMNLINIYKLLAIEVFIFLLNSSIGYKFTYRIFPFFAIIFVFNFILRFFYDQSL